MKQLTEDIVAIGQDLIEVKNRLSHSQFLEWIKAELEMSKWTAQKFMQVALKFKNVNFTDFTIKPLILSETGHRAGKILRIVSKPGSR